MFDPNFYHMSNCIQSMSICVHREGGGILTIGLEEDDFIFQGIYTLNRRLFVLF